MSDGERVLRELREWCEGAATAGRKLSDLAMTDESGEFFENRAWGYEKTVEEIDRRLAALGEGGEGG